MRARGSSSTAPSSAILRRAAAAPRASTARVGPDGEQVELTVEAPTVVVAAGGIESPALLLRSGVGGPAAGKYLRAPPDVLRQRRLRRGRSNAWNGQFQAIVSLDFADAVEGSGFLVEAVGAQPRRSGRRARRSSTAPRTRSGCCACGTSRPGMRSRTTTAPARSCSASRRRGGRALGARRPGRPRRRRAARTSSWRALHRAAGAQEIFTFHWDELRWREGDDFDAFLARLEAAPNDRTAYSAHQMGSCRLGVGPRRPRSPTAGASSTTPRASGSAMPPRCRRRRASTRC